MNQQPTDAKVSQSGTTVLRFDVIAGLTAAAVALLAGWLSPAPITEEPLTTTKSFQVI